MDLTDLVTSAASLGASDLHLQVGRPLALRIGGELQLKGEALSPQALHDLLDDLLDEAGQAALRQRGSLDLARQIGGRRCRLNLFLAAGRPALALRLLSGDLVTIDTLNLHPAIGQLASGDHGLVLVTGPTGCGKSSTLAALVQEVNLTRTAHIVTLEHPVEYALVPIRAFIRQREVGRDTPSFAQGLADATREDIDVLMVGEMRDRQTMRLTLDAAETGHLVLATLHSATPIEALQRIISAFPAAEQESVRAQLADVLVGVVTQRLVWHDRAGMRVPECEILRGTQAVRAVLRHGDLFKLRTVLETGGREGNWTLQRYRAWLAERRGFHHPGDAEVQTRPGTRPATGTRAPAGAGAPPGTRAAPDPVSPGNPGGTADGDPHEGPRDDPVARPPAGPSEAGDLWVIAPEDGTLRDAIDELEQD